MTLQTPLKTMVVKMGGSLFTEKAIVIEYRENNQGRFHDPERVPRNSQHLKKKRSILIFHSLRNLSQEDLFDFDFAINIQEQIHIAELNTESRFSIQQKKNIIKNRK